MSAGRLRNLRIVLLKVTHLPIVAIIWAYETVYARIYGERHTFSAVGPGGSNTGKITRPFLAQRDSVHSRVSLHYFFICSTNCRDVLSCGLFYGNSDGKLFGSTFEGSHFSIDDRLCLNSEANSNTLD